MFSWFIQNLTLDMGSRTSTSLNRSRTFNNGDRQRTFSVEKSPYGKVLNSTLVRVSRDWMHYLRNIAFVGVAKENIHLLALKKRVTAL